MTYQRSMLFLNTKDKLHPEYSEMGIMTKVILKLDISHCVPFGHVSYSTLHYNFPIYLLILTNYIVWILFLFVYPWNLLQYLLHSQCLVNICWMKREVVCSYSCWLTVYKLSCMFPEGRNYIIYFCSSPGISWTVSNREVYHEYFLQNK